MQKKHNLTHTHTYIYIYIQYKCRKRDILHRQQHDTQLSYTNTYDEHLFDFETSTPQLPKELGLITSFCKQPVPGVTCFGSRPWRISSPIPDCNLDQEVFLWNSTSLLTWCLKHLTTLQVVASVYESHQQRDNTLLHKSQQKKTPSGPLKCVPFWPRISSPERRPKREGRRRRWVSKRLELVLEIRCSWWPRDAQEIEVQGEGQGETSLKLVINHLPAGLVDSFERLGTDTGNYVLKSLVIYTDYATTILMEGRGYYSPNKDLANMAWSYRNQYLSKLSGAGTPKSQPCGKYRNPCQKCSDDVFSLPQLVRALSL